MQPDPSSTRDHPRLLVVLVALSCFSLAALPAAAAGQQKDGAKTDAKPKSPATVPKISTEPAVTAAKLDAKIKQIEGNESLKKEVKDPVLKLYGDGREQLKAAEAFQKKLGEYEALRSNIDKLTRELKEELKKEIGDPDPVDLPADPKLSDYEAQLAKAKAERDKARDALQELEKQQKHRIARQTEVPKRLEEARRDLKGLQAALAAKPAANELPETAEAQRTFQLARQQALEAEIKALEAELPTYQATADLLLLQIKAANRRVERADKAVAFWTKQVERSRGDEADAQERAARDLLDRLRNERLPQELISIAEENLALSRRRTGSKGTVARIRESVDEHTSRDNELEQFGKDRKSIEEKLKIPGIEDVIGPQLLRLRRRLPSVGKIQRRIASRRRDLAQVYLDLLREEERVKGYVDLDARVKTLVESIAPTLEGEARDDLNKTVKRTLEQRQKLLESLVKDYNSLHTNLVELNTEDQKLINASKELQKLIDKHILWIPSTSPLSIDDLRISGRAFLWLISLSHWADTWGVLKSSIFSRPIVSAFALFLLALVLLKESDLKRRLREAGERAAKGFTEPYTLTIKALALTLLLAAIWPCVLGFLGWHLETFTDTKDFAAAVGNSLQAVAAVLFTLEFLRRMFRPRGLAEAHFRWRDARMQMFRNNLRWFAAGVLPGVFVMTMIEEWGNEEFNWSLGRLTLIGLLLVGGTFLALVLRKPRARTPVSAVAGEHTVAKRQTHLVRLSAYGVAVLFPVALAILAGAGYQYTATLLTWKLAETAWLSIVLVVVHALAMRWLYHARGRLALDRVQEAAAAAAAVAAATESAAKPEAASNGSAAEKTGDGKPSERGTATSEKERPAPEAAAAPPAGTPEREIKQKTAADIATINAQTKRLLRIVIGSAAVIGLWMIWVDVLPALKFLEYPLWSSQTETTRLVGGVLKREPMLKLFTLGDAFIAVTVLVVAFIAATNLPGLLEVAILQKLPIDSGARYAASSIARYVIYAIGIIWGFNLAGISWNKVQWLVAALSVGIGFGLQEIVANFISGLILLFERPLRVGDIVTVGDVTGSVTRIQIRATTVRDWDQREYIIPNKDLMTGKFMNWTLSDTTNRIVINVGVAYGTDADLVQKILLDTAKGHPDVLESPPPHAIFDGFGDSSLNFVLRCCLPSLDKRLPTMHYLHAEIQRRLKKAGIDIPFPQRDLHIRSDDTRGNGASRGKEREREVRSDRLQPVSGDRSVNPTG
jgi:potassium efflux system protein